MLANWTEVRKLSWEKILLGRLLIANFIQCLVATVKYYVSNRDLSRARKKLVFQNKFLGF